MVNQPINLEAKTEDEPPPSVWKEGEELEIPDEGEIPDSYEEITEAIDEATEDKTDETLASQKYIETETPEQDAQENEYIAVMTEDPEYECEYETEEETPETLPPEQEDFFDREVDYVILLLPDNPVDEFRDYYGIKENPIAALGLPFYDGGMARRLVKNWLAGE